MSSIDDRIDPEEPFVGDEVAPSETVWPYDYQRSYVPSKPVHGVYPAQTAHAAEIPVRSGREGHTQVPDSSPLTDEEIKAELSRRLNSDLRLSGRADLQVFVAQRVVAITGTVSNRRLKNLIGQYAWQQSGVEDVHNNVNVVRKAR